MDSATGVGGITDTRKWKEQKQELAKPGCHGGGVDSSFGGNFQRLSHSTSSWVQVPLSLGRLVLQDRSCGVASCHLRSELGFPNLSSRSVTP